MWDARGSLTARGSETFSWDVQGLLASATGPAGTTSFVYDASGQRLLRRAPNGLNTLYVAGHEVTANSTGTLTSAVRTYTFNGQLVATRTGAGVVEYVVSDPAGSVEMAYASGSGAPVMTRAYEPYGQVRSQAGDTATDRGFIGQIEDPSTGLSYLNARYYDTAIGVFISPDPVFDTKRPKTLNPYTYSVGNPTTFTDPSGAYSEYAHGLETENGKLREHNKELLAHIGRLENHIEELQGVIRKQRKAINDLISYAEALEAEIRRQASIIRQLQARIAYLQRVVVAQQREISRLRGIIAYQQGIIRHQAWVIGYYKGIVNVLGFRLWGGTPQYAYVMNEIHSFRGIPAGAFGYDNISIRDATILGLMHDLDVESGWRDVWVEIAGARGDRIEDMEDQLSGLQDLEDLNAALVGALNQAYNEIYDGENFWEVITYGLCDSANCVSGGMGAGSLPEIRPMVVCADPTPSATRSRESNCAWIGERR
jgi:RHS repeat-associated protein